MASRAASEVEAANGALALCGQPPIASLDEATVAARRCKERFADVRDALLRGYDWNFASAWVVPSLDPVAALGALTKRYPLPAECLRVRGVKDLEQNEWAVEAAAVNPGQDAGTIMVLTTNAASPRVNYTRRVELPALWDALFLRQFQLRLGAEIAPQLAREGGLGDRLLQRADVELARAQRNDAREGARGEVRRDTSWLAARRHGGWGR
jgi:hypothetical protein